MALTDVGALRAVELELGVADEESGTQLTTATHSL